MYLLHVIAVDDRSWAIASEVQSTSGTGYRSFLDRFNNCAMNMAQYESRNSQGLASTILIQQNCIIMLIYTYNMLTYLTSGHGPVSGDTCNV